MSREVDRIQVEKVVVPLVQLYAQQHIHPAVAIDGISAHVDFLTQDLVLTLRAYVMGDEGPRLGQRYVWNEYKFPWYTPRWLRRRRTTERIIDCSWQGRVIYPEARIIPDLGTGRRVVEFYQYGPTPEEEQS